eukprot:122709_1
MDTLSNIGVELVFSDTEEQGDNECKTVELITKQTDPPRSDTVKRLEHLLFAVRREESEDMLSALTEANTLFVQLVSRFENDSISHIMPDSLSNNFIETMFDLKGTSSLPEILIPNAARILFVNNRNSDILSNLNINTSDSYVFALLMVNDHLHSFTSNESAVIIMEKYFGVISARLSEIERPLSTDLYLFTFNTLKLLFGYISTDNKGAFDECKSAQLLLEAAHKYKSKYPTKHSHNAVYGKYAALFDNSDDDPKDDKNQNVDFNSLQEMVQQFVNNPSEMSTLLQIKTILVNNTNNMLLSQYDYDLLVKAIEFESSQSSDSDISAFKILFSNTIRKQSTEYNDSDFELRDNVVEIAHNLNNTALLLSIKQVDSGFGKFTTVLALVSMSMQILALLSLVIVLLVNEIQWDNIYINQMSIDDRSIYHVNSFRGDSMYDLHFNSSARRHISEVNNFTYDCYCNETAWAIYSNYSILVGSTAAQLFCKTKYGTNLDPCFDKDCDGDKIPSNRQCSTWDECKITYDMCEHTQTNVYSCHKNRHWEFRQTLCDHPYWVYGVNRSFNSTAHGQYINPGLQLNWVASNQFCAYNYGTSLAVIYDHHDNDQTYSECDNSIDHGGCWIGARSTYSGETDSNGDFGWFDYRPYVGKNLSISNYSNWHTSFTPNIFDKVKSYLQKDVCTYISHNGSWVFSDCTHDKYFLCNNPLWFAPWAFYYEVDDDQNVLPSNWNNKMLSVASANVEGGTGQGTIGIYSTMWDGTASGDIYFFGVISTLILFAYLLKETTQLSELWYLILLSNAEDDQTTMRIGYVFYVLNVVLLISASLCSSTLMVKSSDVVGVLSSVVSVLFILDIDDWIGYFIKHKFNLTSAFYIIKKHADISIRCCCQALDKDYIDRYQTKAKESCCVMAALAHGWSQIWLLQLWSVFLAYHVESITDCDNISARYSSTIGLFSVLTIGVWVATFVYVDSPPMVTKGWMFSSLISGWLFVFIYTWIIISDCQVSDADESEIMWYCVFFTILSGGVTGIAYVPIHCCCCLCKAYFDSGGRLQ